MSYRPVYTHIHRIASNPRLPRDSSRKCPRARIALDHGQKLEAVLLRNKTQAEDKPQSNKATYEAYNRRFEKYNQHGNGSRRVGNPSRDGEARNLSFTTRLRNKPALAAAAQDPVSAPKISRPVDSIAPTETALEPKGYHDPQTFSYHWHTPAPTINKLHYADQFFLGTPCKLLYTVSKLHEMKNGTIPEVAFLGRSNVGKSSLLNALMGQDLCFKSKKPGLTKTMNAFGVGRPSANSTDGKIAILDMPGYGFGSRDAWGQEIMKYLVGRDQLKRAFLLVDAMHGLKPSDIKVLEFLRQNQVSHQVILSKVDRVLVPGAPSAVTKLDQYYATLRKIMENMREHVQPGKGDGPEAVGEILTCSSGRILTHKHITGWNLKVRKDDFIGVAGVRWAVLVATGFDGQSKMDAEMAEFERKKQPKGLSLKTEETSMLGIKRIMRTTAKDRAALLTRNRRATKRPGQKPFLTRQGKGKRSTLSKMKSSDLYKRSKL